MERYVILKNSEFTLPNAPCVLPHALYVNLVNAQDILTQARKKAHIIEEDAKILYEQERKKGYEQGLADSKETISEQMLGLISERLDYLEKMEISAVELVMATLTKLLDDIPPQEKVVSTVKKAIAYVRSQKKVIVRISPEDEIFVQNELKNIKKTYPIIEVLDICVDKGLQQGDCLLESELGIIDASLNKQLQNIERAFMKHVSPKN